MGSIAVSMGCDVCIYNTQLKHLWQIYMAISSSHGFATMM